MDADIEAGVVLGRNPPPDRVKEPRGRAYHLRGPRILPGSQRSTASSEDSLPRELRTVMTLSLRNPPPLTLPQSFLIAKGPFGGNPTLL